MFYLSQLLNATVEDLQQQRVGKIIEVLTPVVRVGETAYPSALLVEGEEEQPWRVPLTDIERHEHILRLLVSVAQLTLQPKEQSRQEVYLIEDVLDKQVIDIVRKKAVRVNDIGLDEDWRILGVDTNTLGLVRRLAPVWLLGAQRLQAPVHLVPWSYIEIISTQLIEEQEQVASASSPTSADTFQASPQAPSSPHISRPQSGQLAELHPADIAEIVHHLTPGQGARLIEGLDDETAADTMEEIDTERQRHILENIRVDRAADILEAMEPDEAADLLAQLPEDRAAELLRLMAPEESEEVQDLLAYAENSAGGLMTTDYIVLNQTRTTAEALDIVRTNIREHDVRIAYIYCVADETQDESHILGVISLWELLVADTTQPLQELMETDIISVQPDTSPREVAEIMAKYNLLAVPVLNSEGILEGVVTVDDALDVLLPNESRRRPTRMY